MVHLLQGDPGLKSSMTARLSGDLINAAIYLLKPDGEIAVLLKELWRFPQGATVKLLQVWSGSLVTLSDAW